MEASELFEEQLYCDCPSKFNVISLYCLNILEKKLPIKSTVNFFRDDSNSALIKDLEGKRSVIRKEFLDLIKNFSKYICNHLLSLNGELYLCKDKSIDDVYVEIAKSLHCNLFHGKGILVLLVGEESKEISYLPVIIPTAESIYKEIKQQLKKSQWNKKNYLQSKLKVKLSTGKQGNNNTADETDFNSDSEDDDKDRVSS
jgi:hypothetical protein